MSELHAKKSSLGFVPSITAQWVRLLSLGFAWCPRALPPMRRCPQGMDHWMNSVAANFTAKVSCQSLCAIPVLSVKMREPAIEMDAAAQRPRGGRLGIKGSEGHHSSVHMERRYVVEAADRGCIMYVMEVEAGHLHWDGERASTAGAAAQHARTFRCICCSASICPSVCCLSVSVSLRPPA